MANEDNENMNDDNLQQQGGEQQQDNNQQQQQNNADPLESMIDDFMKESSREPRTPAQGQGQQNKEGQQNNQQQGQQRQPNNNQQQQGGQNNAGANQNQQVEPPSAGTRKFGNLFHQDGKGNIYNTRGELVAGAGAPHKLFRKLWPYIEKAELEATGFKARIDAIENANAAAKTAGLTADEYGAAIGLMAAFKRDPKAAVQFMLQQAQNRGTDLSDILPGGGGLTEAALRTAVKEMLSEALVPFQPFIQRNQQEQEIEEMRIAANQEYTAFLQDYPDAKPHQGHIASIMEGTQKDMKESYFILKTWVLQNGLDWSKPLAPQAEALKQRQNNGAPNGGGNNQNLPDFNGRTGNGGGAVPANRGMAKADDDWNNIIASAVDDVASGRYRN